MMDIQTINIIYSIICIIPVTAVFLAAKWQVITAKGEALGTSENRPRTEGAFQQSTGPTRVWINNETEEGPRKHTKLIHAFSAKLFINATLSFTLGYHESQLRC
jgi:hypothetical protein